MPRAAFDGVRPLFKLEIPGLSDEEDILNIEEESRRFIEKSTSKSIKQKTDFWMKKLEKHAEELGVPKKFTALSEPQIASLMCSYTYHGHETGRWHKL